MGSEATACPYIDTLPKTKSITNYHSQLNECECEGILNKEPFIYAEGERGSGSICRIEFFCDAEKPKPLDLIIKTLEELYKNINGKVSIAYYKINELEKLILDPNLSKILAKL